MRIDHDISLASERRVERMGIPKTAPVKTVKTELSPPEQKLRNAQLHFAGATPSETEFERTLGTNDLVDEFFLERALVAARPVCRLMFRDGADTGYATGFMVSPSVLLTNWHVFKQQDVAVEAVAEFDYKLDVRGKPQPGTRFVLRPDRFFVNNQELDYALVAVSEVDDENAVPLTTFGHHRLVATIGKIEVGEWISIIQHPSGGYRQFAIRENELLAKEDQYLLYKSDTAPGSSGSPAFNDSFQVVALHHSGKAKKEGGLYVLKDGKKVASLNGVDETAVIWEANEGVRVSVLVESMRTRLDTGNRYVQELLTAIQAEQGDIMSNVIRSGKVDLGSEMAVPNNGAGTVVNVGGSQGGIVIPLELRISVSMAGAAAAPAPAVQPVSKAPTVIPAADGTGEEAFKMKQPYIETPYSNRKGYDEDFLGTKIPLPDVSDVSLLAKMNNGKHVIPYEHFSIMLHKERRMVLVAAWNVDGAPKARQPEPKEKGAYTRKGLTGLADFEVEKWKTDPRIAASDQLPDAFYTNDGGAFDKGHVARREDVCWGSTYKQVRRGNGDSYHVTNCTPQVKEFNQSQAQGIWGELENFILKQAEADSDKYSMFAGPVFADTDRVFDGVDEDGSELRVLVPEKFWKVVVANVKGQLAVFPFLLEQDLTKVALEDEEFKVTSEWKPFLISLSALENLLGVVEFPQVMHDADQSGDDGAHEALRKQGVEVFPKKKVAAAGSISG